MKTPAHLRDHLFVLAWVVLAVVAKYSISLTAPTEASLPKIDRGLATASAVAVENEYTITSSPSSTPSPK
jgi:hypothetical protein